MDLQLTNRTVLVTGGSKGIGLACARAFLAEGAHVAIVSRDARNLDQAQAKLSGKAVLIKADLVEADQAQRMLSEAEHALGPIDILVNSAGAAKRTLPDELTTAAWHAAMDAKYFTYIHAMHAVLAGMKARRRGAIVNIIGAGGKVATPYHLPGGAANSALMLASIGMANAFGRYGVRINGINPGATRTDRVNEAILLEAKSTGVSAEKALEDGQARVPLGRYADPDDVAAVALFLASERAGYVTGAIVPMDGGLNPVL